jgi:hypothetical protein
MKLLSRKKVSADVGAAPVIVKPGGKNRPTPKRTEARSSRPVTPYLSGAGSSRKENAKIDRERRRGKLDEQRAAMKGTGDLAKMPARDARPEAGFVRELVDNRRNLVTLVLAAYALLFLNFLVKGNYLILTLMITIVFVAITDGFVLAFQVKRAVRREFPDSREKVRLYAVQRAVMPRRMRLPRPGVGTPGTSRRGRR